MDGENENIDENQENPEGDGKLLIHIFIDSLLQIDGRSCILNPIHQFLITTAI